MDGWKSRGNLQRIFWYLHFIMPKLEVGRLRIWVEDTTCSLSCRHYIRNYFQILDREPTTQTARIKKRLELGLLHTWVFSNNLVFFVQYSLIHPPDHYHPHPWLTNHQYFVPVPQFYVLGRLLNFLSFWKKGKK